MLSDIYAQWRLRAASEVRDEVAEAFYPPLMIQQPSHWAEARHRVMYVGQETRGWTWNKAQAAEHGYSWPYKDSNSLLDFIENQDSVEALIDGYRQFDFAARQPTTRRSPHSGATFGKFGK